MSALSPLSLTNLDPTNHNDDAGKKPPLNLSAVNEVLKEKAFLSSHKLDQAVIETQSENKVDAVAQATPPLKKPHRTRELKDLVSFLKSSPTAWQAVEQMKERLLQAGFVELNERDPWQGCLKPGKKYFVTRNDSSLCAFVLPQENVTAFNILGAHTDSPCFKLKPNPELTRLNTKQFGVEVYGGPTMPSWVNRDLGLAGRIVVTNEQGELETVSVHIKKPIAIIPSLPIHLDRSLKTKLEVNAQIDMSAVVGVDVDLPEGSSLLEHILRKNGYTFKSLLSHELFLVPSESPHYVGIDHDMLASWRLDNLLGTDAALQALLQSQPGTHHVKILAAWDNEEVGSETAQGAASNFLTSVCDRIIKETPTPDHMKDLYKHQSLLVSIDVAHAVNPNVPSKHDGNHQPTLNCGVVHKINSQQNYATDAQTLAVSKKICQENGIPSMEFVVRSDSACGTTIGPISAVDGWKTIDLGAPIWSMHNIREICSPKDHLHMIKYLGKMLDAKPLY